MDNKKWYKKFATIFWWAFTILPIIVTLIQFTGYHLTFNSGISTGTDLANYHDLTSGSFNVILTNVLRYFDSYNITFLKTTFSKLFEIIGVTNYAFMGILFGYMASIQMYHLLYDLLVFFIHLIHEYSEPERWCK